MELIRGLQNIKPNHRGCVLTIGNFDGVHLGHQAVLSQVKQIAKGSSLPAVVMVFEPQPLELFNPAAAPARLTRFREKYHWLKVQGLDHCCSGLCYCFDHWFVSGSHEEAKAWTNAAWTRTNTYSTCSNGLQPLRCGKRDH